MNSGNPLRSALEADLIAARTVIGLLRAHQEGTLLDEETVSMLSRGKTALQSTQSTAVASDAELERAVPNEKLRSVLAPFKHSLEPLLRESGDDEEVQAVIAIIEKALRSEALTTADLSRASKFFAGSSMAETQPSFAGTVLTAVR